MGTIRPEPPPDGHGWTMAPHMQAGLWKLLESAAARTLVWPADQRYDVGMTMAKIAISLPKHQLARVHREVRAGRADSVSGYIASVLAEQEKRDSLRTLLHDLIQQHGEPAPEDVKWAERMLPRRGRG
jgi:Arc/MetJ-type ribon-helix-helix transcriptional regulator